MKISNLNEGPKTRVFSPYQKANEIARRLESLKEDISDSLEEAGVLLRNLDNIPGFRTIVSRANSYWYPHIKMALDNNHDYLGGDTTMQETIDDIIEETEGGEG